jgi:SulP family sulfate permease
MVIIWGLPKMTKVIPAPLAGIGDRRGVVIGFGIDVPRVGDLASIKGACRNSTFPGAAESGDAEDHPALCVHSAAIGLIESLLTLNLVGEMTGKSAAGPPGMHCAGHGQCRHRFLRRHGRLRDDWPVHDQREIRRPHAALRHLGGAVPAGFILVGSSLIEQIPLAALVGVMFMVVIGTFAWNSCDHDPHPADRCDRYRARHRRDRAYDLATSRWSSA